MKLISGVSFVSVGSLYEDAIMITDGDGVISGVSLFVGVVLHTVFHFCVVLSIFAVIGVGFRFVLLSRVALPIAK